jgi:hypothetical protein
MSLSFGNSAATPSVPNFQRFLGNDIEVLSYPTQASTAINVGDLLVFNTSTGVAAPVSTVAWDTNAATTATDASTVWLGVSLGQKLASDPTTTNIPVAVFAVVVFPCSALGSAAYPGTYVTFAAQGTTNLSDFTVTTTGATSSNCIGKLAQVAGSGATSLQFYTQSTLIYGALAAA